MKETELAWAAGFFDGEGCIYITGHTPCISIGQKYKEPLQRFAEILHLQNICAISKRNTSYDFYNFCASGENAIRVLRLLYPHLILKKNKALEVINMREIWANKNAAQLPFAITVLKIGNKEYEGENRGGRGHISPNRIIINDLKSQGCSFAYIGRFLGISRQRAHQIYKEGKKTFFDP